MSTNYYLKNEATGELDHVGQYAARSFTFRSHRTRKGFFPLTFGQLEEKVRNSRHLLVDEYGTEQNVDAFFAWVKTTEKRPKPWKKQSAPSSQDPEFFDPAGWRFLGCEFC